MSRILITILAVGLLGGAVFFFKHNQSAARARAMASGPAPVTVTATTVRRVDWAQRIEGFGDMRAVQDVAVAPEVPGKVIGIEFESGAPVAAGSVLVRLDAADDRAQLEALQAELQLAQLEYERMHKLRGSAAFSQSALDRTQSQMASLQAQAERQRVLLERKVVRAPFDGVLGIRDVSLGTIVAAGTPIVQLQSVAPIYVDFTVPEQHRSVLRPGLALEARVAAWPDAVFPGELLVISPAVDARSRTLSLRGQLANADGRLQPGMFATVHLIVSEAVPVATLPRTAISFFAYGESVFTIAEADGRLIVQRQPIRIGRTRDDQVEILDGLEVGRRVVHTGHMKLRDGQAIVIDAGIPLPQGMGDR